MKHCFFVKQELLFLHTHYYTAAGSRTLIITLRIIESKFPELGRIAPCILESCASQLAPSFTHIFKEGVVHRPATRELQICRCHTSAQT